MSSASTSAALASVKPASQSLLSTQQRKWVVMAVLALSVAGVGAAYYVSSRKKKPKSPRRKKGTAERSTSDDVDASEPSVMGAMEAKRAADIAPPAKQTSSPTVPVTDKYSDLSESERSKRAQELKNQGNDLFKSAKYADAIDYYTQAIELQPKSAVFWCNRAACYANLSDYENVIADCNQALQYDPTYVKALHRRALAYEHVGRLREAYQDFTAICFLDGFKNQTAVTSAERLLKTISEARAKEMMPGKEVALPSPTFVSAYMEAFRAVPSAAPDTLKHPAETARYYFNLAKDHIAHRRYDDALAASDKAYDLAEKDKTALTSKERAELYNIHGTFLFLKGQAAEAIAAFDRSIEADPSNASTLIKRANVSMDQGDPQATLASFETAVAVNPQDPDVYYHRGQVHFLMNSFDEAIVDYQRSIDLDPNFVFAFIQLGVAQYKAGQIQRGLATFKKAMNKFPTASDLHNYYGELLMDQQRFPDAMQSFEKALSLSPSSPLPYINKALLHFQWQGDVKIAEALMKQAIEKDPRCDVAYVQLANMQLHHGDAEDAMANFDKAIECARTEAELVNAVSAKESSTAQFHVMKTLPPSALQNMFA
ncbi:TOM (translocase of outer membrane) complex component [Sorochytrium milnesiophthora]